MARALLFIVTLSLFTVDASALSLFGKRVRRRAIPTRTAVIDDSFFTLVNGALYRRDPVTEVLKSVSRRPHLEKIARFKEMLVGRTYSGELKFWRQAQDRSWQPVTDAPAATGIVDFSANQNVLVTADRRGNVHQWASLQERSLVPGPVGIVTVEGYAAELGFGLINDHQFKINLVPHRDRCGEVLVEVSRP